MNRLVNLLRSSGAWSLARLAALSLLALVAVGCPRGASEPASDRPLVVVTTTMLEEVTSRLGGEDVRVEGLLRPGADPHLYQPVPSDARRIARSRLVIMNGLGLEGWMERLLRNAGGQRPVVSASEGQVPLEDLEAPTGVDPHIWFDVGRWIAVSGVVERALLALLWDDAEAMARVEERARTYRGELERLEAWVRAQVETVPAERRVLVTSHDAFGYFGQAYGFQVEAIQGITTEQEASQRDVIRVVELVRERGVPAVFAETSVDAGLVRQVSREAGVEVLGPLYSDSLGEPGSGAETYVGMVVANVGLVVEGLGGQVTPFAEVER